MSSSGKIRIQFIVKIACLLTMVYVSSNVLAHTDKAAGDPAIIPLNLGEPSAQSHTATTVRFGVVSDLHVTPTANILQISNDMLDHNLDLVLYPGDLVNYGSNSPVGGRWADFVDKTVGVFAAAGQDIDLYMVPGNHDTGGSTSGSSPNSGWQDQFDAYPGTGIYAGTYYDSQPWLPDSQTVGGAHGPQTGVDQMDYYVDYGNTRFISITTDRDDTPGYTVVDMLWFENVLNHADTLSKDHVFIMTHHPVTYTGYENAGGTGGSFWQAMVDSGAKVHGLFVGHWHQYQPGTPDPLNPDLWEVNLGVGTPTPASGHGLPWQNRTGFGVFDVNGAEVTAQFYIDSSGDNGPYDPLADSFVMHSATAKPTGLVAEYLFSNGSSNLDTAPSGSSGGVHPLLGKENHGLYHNGASVTGGKVVLDGTNDYASGYSIGDYNMCLLRDLMISIKVKVDSLSGDADGNTLISHSSNMGYGTQSSEVVNQPYNLRIRDDKKLVMMWERNHAVKKQFVSTVAAANLDDGSEHEILVMRNADAGEVSFFVDGTKLGATLTFDKLTELPTGGQEGHIRIGCNFYDAWSGGVNDYLVSGFFDGTIDDVRLWNYTYNKMDFNVDGNVDLTDFSILASQWNTCTQIPNCIPMP